LEFDNLAVAGANPSDTLGDVQGLTAAVPVPVGVCTRREMHGIDA
jgi:hypothetical protein